MKLNCNCCDGVYNSYDVHFTSICDNKCKHCVDLCYEGLKIPNPNPYKIAMSIIENSKGFDDVLFLGGEPCLFLKDLNICIGIIKEYTNLKIYVTTSLPITCKNEPEEFKKMLEMVDGLNISVQHYKEDIADQIRNVRSKYDRQKFYKNLTHKEKIRINLNIVKPYLYEKEDILNCIQHYNDFGFNEIKLSEIQHGKEYFVSFEDIMGIKLKSPFAHGCQNVVNVKSYLPNFTGKLLLKRSCFMCEGSLYASVADLGKVIINKFRPIRNKYGVVYEDGTINKGWI